MTTNPTTPGSEDGLLPCPFCGDTHAAFNTHRTSDQELIRLNGRDTGFGVNCTACAMGTRVMALGYATKELAATAWNRRLATTEDPGSSVAQGEALIAQINEAGTGNPMKLRVALDFADNPRPYPSLAVPADTNGELYKALRVLAAAYREVTTAVAGKAAAQ